MKNDYVFNSQCSVCKKKMTQTDASYSKYKFGIVYCAAHSPEKTLTGHENTHRPKTYESHT